MKFLADENVAPFVVNALEKAGFAAETVKNQGLTGASDEKIIKIAQTNNFIILTHDKDFGNLLHYPLQSHKGVILLRLKNQSPRNVTLHLLPFLKKISPQKILKRLTIITEKGARIT